MSEGRKGKFRNKVKAYYGVKGDVKCVVSGTKHDPKNGGETVVAAHIIPLSKASYCADIFADPKFSREFDSNNPANAMLLWYVFVLFSFFLQKSIFTDMSLPILRD